MLFRSSKGQFITAWKQGQKRRSYLRWQELVPVALKHWQIRKPRLEPESWVKHAESAPCPETFHWIPKQND